QDSGLNLVAARSDLEFERLADGGNVIGDDSRFPRDILSIGNPLEVVNVDRAIHNYSRPSILTQAVNLRGKTASLIPENSCGNLWGFCATKATSLETTEELADLLSDSINKMITNFSKVDHNTEEGQMIVLNSLSPMSDMINVGESTNLIVLTSWCKFPFGEADFSFGNPTLVAPGTIPMKNIVYLMDDARVYNEPKVAKEVIAISSNDENLSSDEEILLMCDIPLSDTDEEQPHATSTSIRYRKISMTGCVLFLRARDAPTPVNQYVRKPIKSQVKVTSCVLALRVSRCGCGIFKHKEEVKVTSCSLISTYSGSSKVSVVSMLEA
ncbi:pelargonidin 3-O-(6-caffeoylglucoside) 5-O-(6-O-malonylglucoside) 4'''-malonyltransferase, partial [Tanacetum coccineum]